MMSVQERNKEIVYRFNKEFIEKGNEEAYWQLVDRAFINRTAPAGANTAEASFNFIVNVLHKAITPLRVDVHQQIAENDLVVTYKTFSGIHVSDFGDIKPSGREVRMHIMDIIRLKDGKYIEHWSVRDVSEIMRQSLAAQS